MSADLEPAAGGGLTLRWSSVPGKTYSVLRTQDLDEAFRELAPAIPATGPVTSFVDPSALGSGPYFYRIRVRE
jgi:hypothetical protein